MVGTKAVRQALYQKLNVAGVTTLLAHGSASIYHHVAPDGSDYPMLIFNKQSGVARLAFGAPAMDFQLWLVKGITKDKTSSPSEDIDAAVRTALDFQDLPISGGRGLFLARESDVDYAETDGDTQYRHCGGLYRVVVS